MAQPDLALVLDRCIERMRQGETLETCLAAYPHQAAELRPVLALSADLAQLPPLTPSPETSAKHLARMMAAFDQRLELQKRELEGGLAWFRWLSGWLILPAKPRRTLPLLARGLALVLLVVVISGSLVVNAAAGTLPGDTLYQVKRSVEDTRLSLTLDQAARASLAERFNRERLDELAALRALGRPAEVDFAAPLVARDTDVWLIQDLPVGVTDQTRLTDGLAVGDVVNVRARLDSDGTLTALEINGRPVDRPQLLPTASPTPTASATHTRPAERPTDTPVVRPSRTPLPEASATHRPTATHEPPAVATGHPSATPRVEPSPTRPHGATPTRDNRPTRTTQPTAEHTRDVKATVTAIPPVLATVTPVPTPPPTRDSAPTPKIEPTPTDHPPPPTHWPTPEPSPTKKPNDRPPTPTPTPQRDGNDDGRHP